MSPTILVEETFMTSLALMCNFMETVYRPEDLSDQGIKQRSPALQVDSLSTELSEKHIYNKSK